MSEIFENFDWKNGEFDEVQKMYLKQYAQEQIDIYLGTEGDEDLAWQEIKKAYKVAGLKQPKEIVWYDSPNKLASVWGSVGASVWDSVGDSVGDSVRDSVWGSVRASVWDSVWDSVRDSVWGSVRASVWDSVRASVWDSVGASVWDSVRDSVGDSVWDSVGAYYDADYNSWLKFYNDNMEKNDFIHMATFAEQCAGYYFEKDKVHAARKPKRLVTLNGRLHYDHDKAIEWQNGYGFYYLHGVEFDEKTWKQIVEEKITLENLGEIENADQRAVAVQMLKPELLLKQVGAKLIHTGEKDGTELYRVDNFMDTGETEYCMKMEHPSIKGKFYIEWVEPKIGEKKDADLAQATAFGLTKEQYLIADLA